VDYGAALEMRFAATRRGFESLPLRHVRTVTRAVAGPVFRGPFFLVVLGLTLSACTIAAYGTPPAPEWPREQSSQRTTMDDPTFWALISKLDWTHEGDDARVVEPVVVALSAMSEVEISAFQEALAVKLYQLDGRAWAKESGGMIWWGEPDSLSVDGFLYSRCAVVANGKDFYEVVLGDPEAMPKDLEFESLLYMANTAFERRTGREPYDELDTQLSYETFSNEAGWP